MIFFDETREILENTPCPECGEVEVFTIDSEIWATCDCADRPWNIDDLPKGESR